MKLISYTTKSWAVLLVLVMGTFSAALLISNTATFQKIELNITNQLFKLRGPLTVQDSTIVLVSISQSADAEIPYKYPWPTYFYAKLIENLNRAGAKAIGFDVIFDKEDTYSLKNDSLFARALQKYGNVVLAGNIHTRLQNRGGSTRSLTSSLVQPTEILAGANPNSIGLVNTVKDSDEQIRRYLLYNTYNEHRYYSLALELLRIYRGWDHPKIKDGKNHFTFGSYNIPKDSKHTMRMNYFGRASTFQAHSFDMVIDDTTITLASEKKAFPINSFSNPDYGLLANNVFKDKIVLVGSTMPTLNDFHSTPFAGDRTMPGYEVHANAIQTILTGKYLYQPENWIQLLILLVLSVCVVAIIQSSSIRRAFLQFGLLIAFIITAVIAGFLKFNYESTPERGGLF